LRKSVGSDFRKKSNGATNNKSNKSPINERRINMSHLRISPKASLADYLLKISMSESNFQIYHFLLLQSLLSNGISEFIQIYGAIKLNEDFCNTGKKILNNTELTDFEKESIRHLNNIIENFNQVPSSHFSNLILYDETLSKLSKQPEFTKL
jgi:hypothetical protein